MKKLTKALLTEFLLNNTGVHYFGVNKKYYWKYGWYGLTLYQFIDTDFVEIAHCNFFRDGTLKQINAMLLKSSQEIASQY